MPQLPQCPKCGGPLSSALPDALCPTCVLRAAYDFRGPKEGGNPSDVSEGLGRVGGYKLLEKIGEGGLGVVYMAEQKEPIRRRVAIKLIKPGMDSREVIARFEAERQALALMEHPNIARIFDAGTTESGHPYFAMELVRGIPVTEYCDRHHLTTRERLKLFVTVSQAVQHAHQKGIIHRDLKPSNILVTVNDGVGVPKIIDFGIAKATEQPLTDKTLFTRFNQLLGTPAYMSPEQAEMTSLDIDTRTDIYSLGVLLYELLTGRTPFDPKELFKAGLEHMLRIIRETEPARPSARLSTLAVADLTVVARQRQTEPPKLVRSVHGDLDWIVMKCLEKDRARRYVSASALAEDLGRHLASHPVEASPPTVKYRLDRFVRRNRLMVAAATSVVLALILGILGSGWQWRRAEKSSAENRRRLARSQVIAGLALQEQGDLFASSLCFAEALRLEENAPVARVNRLRIGSILQRAPKLVSLWVPEGELLRTQFSSDAKYVVRFNKAGRVFDAGTGQPITPLLTHGTEIKHAEFSRDGRVLVTIDSGSAQAWSLPSGTPLGSRCQGSSRFPLLSSDGSRLALIVNATNVQVYNVTNGQPAIPRLPHPAAERIRCIAFAPNGGLIATAIHRMGLVWDARTGNLLTQLHQEILVTQVAFSPDSKRVVMAGEKMVRIWNAGTGKALMSLWHQSPVLHAQFSPDGRYVVTTADDSTVYIWNAETGLPIGPVLKHDDRWLGDMSFSPDARRVLVAGGDTIKVWDLNSAQQSMPPLKHQGVSSRPVFSLDGRLLRTSSEHSGIQTWDLAPALTQGRTLRRPTARWGVINKTADRLIVLGPHDEARVWNLETGECVGDPLVHDGGIRGADFSGDGRRLVTCSDDKTARVWDAESGRPITAPLLHGFRVEDVSFSHNGQRVVTTIGDETAQVWDVPSGKAITPPVPHAKGQLRTEFSPGEPFLMLGPKFSPDDRLILALDPKDFTARMYDVTTGQPTGRVLQHDEPITCAEFSPDGKYIVTVGGRNVQIWTGSTRWWRKGPKLSHQHSVLEATFSPDSRRLFTTTVDSVARLWNPETGEPTTPPFKHDANKGPVKWGADARLLLTVKSGFAHLLDAANGLPAAPPLPWADSGVWLSPDAGRVITIQGGVRIWKLKADNRPVEDLIRLGQLFSARDIDITEALSPLDAPTGQRPPRPSNLVDIAEELLPPWRSQPARHVIHLWKELSGKYPDDFTVSRDIIAGWHESEAVEAEHQKHWFAAAFHLRHLKQFKPTDADLIARLANAENQIKGSDEVTP